MFGGKQVINRRPRKTQEIVPTIVPTTVPIKQEPDSPAPPQKKRKRPNEDVIKEGSATNPLVIADEVKNAMKETFKRGDENNIADDSNLETQNAWGYDSDL